MKIEDVTKLSPLDRLMYWITEREAIRVKKAQGLPKPWTDDVILQSYRFCNVRRMDDKVSRWFLHNWYVPHHGHPNMLLACCLARQFNNPESMNAIGFPTVWRPKRFIHILNARTSKSLTNFNGAYMITGTYGGPKVNQVIERFLDPLYHDHIEPDTGTIRGVWAQLIGRPGFRSFLAGQVVADLRWATEGQWKDRNTWAPLGPGSLRGMNRLHERWSAKPQTEDEFVRELNALINIGVQRLPEAITSRMEAMDWQNCLCEFDKYSRTLFGQGRPKQNYAGACR